MTLSVADAGPADWVENDAGWAIIDASPDACQNLFGSSSCGWSDANVVTATASLSRKASNQTFQVTPKELQEMIEESNQILRSRGYKI